MNITTFKEKDFLVKRKSDATIRVNYNRLNISTRAVELLGLKQTDRVLIHQDNKETSTWYLSLDKEGFRLAPVKVKKNPTYYVYNKDLASMILAAFDLKEGDAFSFMVEEEPIEHKGVKYWKLIPQ